MCLTRQSQLEVHVNQGFLYAEGLFHYNAHFIITLFSLGSQHELYNEVAVYFNNVCFLLCLYVHLRAINLVVFDITISSVLFYVQQR